MNVFNLDECNGLQALERHLVFIDGVKNGKLLKTYICSFDRMKKKWLAPIEHR